MSAPIPLDELEFDPELVHGYWVRVASAFIRSPRFTPTAKTLYTLLLTYAGQRCVAWPGQVTLCEVLAVSPNTLRKALGELSAAGLVAIQRRGDGKTARYSVRKWTPDSEIQIRNFCVSETSRSSKSEHPSEIETAKRNRDSGGYARVRTHEKPSVNQTKAAAADDSKNAPEGKGAEPASAGAAEDPKSAAGTSPAPGMVRGAPVPERQPRRPAASSPSLPGGVKLIDAEPDALEALQPEDLLRRFRAEHPSRWPALEKIAARPTAKYPRKLQRLEALAILSELRDQRQRDAEKTDAPKIVRPEGYGKRLLSPQERAIVAAGGTLPPDRNELFRAALAQNAATMAGGAA